MRRALKSLAEGIGTASGLAALARRRAPDAVAVLAYHNVVAPADAGRGDASLHLPLPRFLEQIERISRTHEIVDLRRLPDRTGRRPRAIITFDDAYRGAVTLALPELARRGLPATVFVAPGLLGAPHTWWDAMAEAGLLDGVMRDRMLAEHGGHHAAVLAATFGERAPPPLPPSYGIATEAELRAHCRDGISVGSHTWAHEFLPALAGSERTATLERALAWVRAFTPDAVEWLALPYGGGSEGIGRAALALGHAGVLRIDGGVWQPTSPREWVPRLNVPAGLSSRGLELRASGVTPRAPLGRSA